jgi:uncharacterized protein YbjQ (UPF0145 family)
VPRSASPVFLPATLALLAGCATPPSGTAGADQVTVHESVASAPQRYEIIKRLRTESLSSLFGTSGNSSVEDALADFRNQATGLGGNGVINFACYSMVIEPRPEPGSRLACNGTVVRFQ